MAKRVFISDLRPSDATLRASGLRAHAGSDHPYIVENQRIRRRLSPHAVAAAGGSMRATILLLLQQREPRRDEVRVLYLARRVVGM